MSLRIQRLAPDAGFLSGAARAILDFARSGPNAADLSVCQVLLPNLKLAAPLAEALGVAAGSTLLLPQMATLSGFAEPWLAELQALPDARRQLILHALLRGKGWFDEALLWDIVAELTALFDALTEASVSLPVDEAELLAELEAAFELRDSASLAFEAKLVNTLWRAEAEGRPSRAMARILGLRRALDRHDAPLVFIAEDSGLGPLQALIDSAAERLPVLLILPDRAEADDALARTLVAAWPLAAEAPALLDRTADLPEAVVRKAADRVCLMACESLEVLAQAVADQVLAWLREGRRDIALIACDRLAARRARALLEREGVLVLDETGWKMATTRVAAVVDAWLEVIASDAYHRDLIDLLRAPLLFGGADAMQRGMACLELESLIRERNLANGLDRIRAEAAQAAPEAAGLLARLAEARGALAPQQKASIPDWLRRLEKSLEILGALSSFAADQAGRQWLDWLHTRMAELAGDEGLFGFSAWRAWFNRQMDTQLFRDESIDSPVVMTHLAATRLRSFEAVIVIGADAEHLAPPNPPAWLAHAGLRRQLGLPELATERVRLREDLAGLLLASGESAIAWQAARRDEALLPAAEVDVLQAALRLALGDSPVKMPAPREVPVSAELAPAGLPRPAVPRERVPQRLSASSLQSLVNCPYQYFARHILRLNELEDLQDGLEKRDFGELLHAILKRFHERFPTLAGQTDAALLAELESLSEDAFAQAVGRNFQDHAWRLRWLSRLPAYIAWQREREQAGWRWAAGEEGEQRAFELDDGALLSLVGRIDRRDSCGDETALLDYKSRSKDALAKQVKNPDDVQLAFYSLLKGTHIGEAAYVALDGDRLEAVPLPDPELRAELLADGINASFTALRAGAGLPAHGSASACAWCEMNGLCRHEWRG